MKRNIHDQDHLGGQGHDLDLDPDQDPDRQGMTDHENDLWT